MPNQIDDDFQFGSTLYNGQSTEGSETNRRISNQKNSKSKKVQQNSKQQYAPASQSMMIGRQNYNLSRARHPGVCLATILFKGSAFFSYFFLSFVMSNIGNFILTIVLGSLDFWVVKNISGRLLVGLRWWTVFDENGNQKWEVQTHGQNFKPNPIDSSFFWTSQIGAVLVWGIFLFLNILQFDLLGVLLLGINFSFCSTNLYGYYLCHGEHKKKLSSLTSKIKKVGLQQILSRLS